jgi:outer membrane protein OmpA-like peptidoglycan-associated protein
VATIVSINGLDFLPGTAELSAAQKQILQQVFNALEEITENTVGDTDAVRVAEFAKLEFNVIGNADSSDTGEKRVALAEARARTVIAFLTHLGTPPWRLHLKAAGIGKPGTGLGGKAVPAQHHVEFVRIK